jgi:hypothetical protein
MFVKFGCRTFCLPFLYIRWTLLLWIRGDPATVRSVDLFVVHLVDSAVVRSGESAAVYLLDSVDVHLVYLLLYI